MKDAAFLYDTLHELQVFESASNICCCFLPVFVDFVVVSSVVSTEMCFHFSFRDANCWL